VTRFLKVKPQASQALDAVFKRECEVEEVALREVAAEFMGEEEELRDFLAADALGVLVDPKFKAELLAELWELVRTKFRGGENPGRS